MMPTLKERCTGCGRTDLVTMLFRCTWPDGKVTVERHCPTCRLIWQRQLRSLGATLEEVDQSDLATAPRGL